MTIQLEHKKTKPPLHFDELWLEVVLTKGVLWRDDLTRLADAFGVEFSGKNWKQKLPAQEIGRVLLFDVPTNALLRSVKKTLAQERYSDLLTYEECKTLHGCLSKLNRKTLIKFYARVGSKKRLSNLLKDKAVEAEIDKNMLLFSFLQEFYGVGSIV